MKFNYQSIGSGGGIKQITAKTVDFGASDAILNADQLKAAPGIQMLPTVAGAVVPVYNLTDLKGSKQPLVLDSQPWPTSSWARSPSGTIRLSSS